MYGEKRVVSATTKQKWQKTMHTVVMSMHMMLILVMRLTMKLTANSNEF
jgi:hypothetical protein